MIHFRKKLLILFNSSEQTVGIARFGPLEYYPLLLERRARLEAL